MRTNLGPLAEMEFLRAIRDGMNAEPTVGETALFFGAASALLLTLMIAAQLGRRPRPKGPTPRQRLTAAIDVLGLPEQTRRDLSRIAKRRKTLEPVALLLSPCNLARALYDDAALHHDARLMQRMDALARRLFDEALPAKNPPHAAQSESHSHEAPKRESASAKSPKSTQPLLSESAAGSKRSSPSQ